MINKIIFLFCLFNLLTQQNVVSQIVIGSPNLGFSQACANVNFNSYNTTFVFSPSNGLDASNQFSIELSDESGNFTNASTIFTSTPGAIISSPATINFSLPITTAGEDYRIRIKSSAPLASSSPSAYFAAYYKSQDEPFTINNLVSTGVYCAGGNYLLTIDNPGTGSNDSPLNYPDLTFKWFRLTGPTTSIFVADGPTLLVNQPGKYFVRTNYGSCTSSSFSNLVDVSMATSGQINAEIYSILGNTFCPDQGGTILSTLSGNSYQWFYNGNLIENATSQMYETIESGTYSVMVDLGSCSASGEITITSEIFEASINVEETNTIEENESLTVEVSTTATAPVFQWYFNDVLISSATQYIFEASEPGSYQVIVTETNGCQTSRVLSFNILEAYNPFPNIEKIPNVISPNGDGINDTWVIPTQYVTGSKTNVTILSNRGEVVLKTNDYLNNWPQTTLVSTSTNQVYYYIITTQQNEVIKGSITLLK